MSEIIIPFESRKDVNVKHKKFNNKYLQKHWHQFFEIEVFISGSGTHIINGISYPIKKGEMHLMKLTDIHEFSFESNCELYLVQIPTQYLSEDINSVILNCKKDMIVYFDENEFEKIEQLYKLLVEEKNKKDLYNPGIIKSLITTLILMFFRKLNVNEKDIPDKYNDRMNNIIIYMQNNFQHPLSLAEIAEKFYMNSEYFSRYFKKHMGIGPKEYLVGIRMEYAKKAVQETQLKSVDICMACGYNSMTTFLRDFKQTYNCTPKKMRAKKI